MMRFTKYMVALLIIIINTNLMAAALRTKTILDKKVYTEDNLNILVTSKQPVFVLKLKSNPTTGYSWFLRDYAADLIAPMKHSFEKAEEGLIGLRTMDF